MIAIASTSKIVATTRLNVPAGVMIPFLKSTESADKESRYGRDDTYREPYLRRLHREHALELALPLDQTCRVLEETLEGTARTLRYDERRAEQPNTRGIELLAEPVDRLAH